MAKIVPSERLRRELDEVLAGVGEHDDPVEADRAARRAADLAAGAGGRGDGVPRPRALRARRREPARSTATAMSRGGEDDERARWSSSARASATRAAGVREPGARQGRGAHARAGVADHRSFLRGPVGARRRGAAGGGARRAGRRQVDGRPDLPGHARALPRVVRASARRARPRLLLPGRDLPASCAPTTSPPRACWSPGASRWRARRSCSGCSSGSRESYESWLDFGRDLQRRGMRAPALIIADGAPGIWKATARAVAEPRSSSAAPCTRSGTSPASCPSGTTASSRRATGPSSTTRPPRPTRKAGLLALAGDYRRAYPSAMAVITDNLDALVAHLRFPLEHRKRTRSTNLLERTFVEVRRRTKVIGRFPGETSALLADLGRARARQPRLARRHHDPDARRRDRTPPPPPQHSPPSRRPRR